MKANVRGEDCSSHSVCCTILPKGSVTDMFAKCMPIRKKLSSINQSSKQMLMLFHLC